MAADDDDDDDDDFECEDPLIVLEVAGPGIVFYSPASAQHIRPGSDYFSSHYLTEDQVQTHIQAGTIVGFGTGTPGVYVLRILFGYPEDDYAQSCQFKLRLGLRVSDGVVCVRDLNDLSDWDPQCPPEQMLELEDGIYHVTLCSDIPETGVLGDGQIINTFLHKLKEFPKLATEGIPTLCMD